MNENIIKYLNIRFTYLIELCYIVKHDLYNYILLNHDNIKDYDEILLEYEIIKSNNKIVCMNKDFKIIDINKLSLNQIGMMRIKYNSFGIILSDKKDDITNEYLDKLKEDIKKIIDEIKDYHNNEKEYNELDKEMTYSIDYLEKDRNKNYIVSNIRYYMDKFDNSSVLHERVKILANIYIFIYNNFENMEIKSYKPFIRSVYNQRDKNIFQIYENIYNQIDKNIIENKEIDLINKYLIVFRIIKYFYMKKYNSKEIRDFICNKLKNQELSPNELKIKMIIEN